MQRTEIDGYTCIFSPGHYYQITNVEGETRTNTRLLCDYKDPSDSIVIGTMGPTYITATSKYYQMIVGYDPDEFPENNGRIEINSRFDESEDIIQWVYYKTGIKESTIKHIMRFVEDPSTFEIQDPQPSHTNNNNNNNSNNPQGGRRSNRKKRTRKQKQRRN